MRHISLRPLMFGLFPYSGTSKTCRSRANLLSHVCCFESFDGGVSAVSITSLSGQRWCRIVMAACGVRRLEIAQALAHNETTTHEHEDTTKPTKHGS
jgi:hypothetical protein